ncbi:hypothetical protein [Paenibacillus graminis]|uniref:Uncharacterized protein n=1 Tax=Paenibacillus graminis TaxID=189425 RepID=A0A089MD37_9BACL|nr:hypothetical protein [Paenibacillus graminis]AIQ70280.1 hypothetical protein PGRAT_23500 [Paenibacillus graminis]
MPLLHRFVEHPQNPYAFSGWVWRDRGIFQGKMIFLEQAAGCGSQRQEQVLWHVHKPCFSKSALLGLHEQPYLLKVNEAAAGNAAASGKQKMVFF